MKNPTIGILTTESVMMAKALGEPLNLYYV